MQKQDWEGGEATGRGEGEGVDDLSPRCVDERRLRPPNPSSFLLNQWTWKSGYVAPVVTLNTKPEVKNKK